MGKGYWLGRRIEVVYEERQTLVTTGIGEDEWMIEQKPDTNEGAFLGRVKLTS